MCMVFTVSHNFFHSLLNDLGTLIDNWIKKSALWLLIWVLDISECQDDHWFTYYSICFVLSDIGIYDQREIPLNLRCLMKD